MLQPFLSLRSQQRYPPKYPELAIHEVATGPTYTSTTRWRPGTWVPRSA